MSEAQSRDESPSSVFGDEVHAPLDPREVRLGACGPLLPAPALHQVWVPARVDPAHEDRLPSCPLGRALLERTNLCFEALQGREIGPHGAILWHRRARRVARTTDRRT